MCVSYFGGGLYSVAVASLVAARTSKLLCLRCNHFPTAKPSPDSLANMFTRWLHLHTLKCLQWY